MVFHNPIARVMRRLQRKCPQSPGPHAGPPVPLLEQIQLQLDDLKRQLDRVERMSHGGRATYVGNSRILTKCVIAEAVFGFLVEAEDVLLSPWFIVAGMYETDVTNFFLRQLRPDSRCLDVGANFGFYTCLMGRFCPNGKVIGIEPTKIVYELLRDNIYLNGLHAWTGAKHAAASDTAGLMALHQRMTRSGNTSIARIPDAFLQMLEEPESQTFQITSLRVDDLLPEFDNRIDFIKIDVEGAEPLVMRGARQAILTNPQLNIVMEWSPGQLQAAGFDLAEFVRELDSLELKAATITATGLEDIPLKDLDSPQYRTAILLSSRRAETTTAGSPP